MNIFEKVLESQVIVHERSRTVFFREFDTKNIEKLCCVFNRGSLPRIDAQNSEEAIRFDH